MREQNKRRIRITHDGSMDPVKMCVTDAESGEMLRYVMRVELVADAKGELTAIVYIHAPEIDVTVDAEIREVS